MTRKYLKENNLVAIPFDKGIGICLMTVSTYNNKLKEITNLSQFEKILPKRKNEKNPIVKEEERIIAAIKRLKESDKISDVLFKKFKPSGSQPPRLYGLAKVHKDNIPLRPVLSMPGSPYHKIAQQIAEWLSVVPECNINSSSKQISESLPSIRLNENHVIVSFDVCSLYTNVPVVEAIDYCTELLYSGKYPLPPIDKDTFRELTVLCSSNVIMSTNNGYFRQVDGLAMGSPPAPLLANGWLSRFEPRMKENATLYSRYMDDILRDIEKNQIAEKLQELNSLHPALKFTIEEESNNTIPFLDMKIIRTENTLSSTWYTKKTDTGLTMNFHSLSPTKYKKSVVSGLIHRIYRACSTWKLFHESLSKAKIMLQNNQYPPWFYEPIIKTTLEIIVTNQTKKSEEEKTEENDTNDEKLLFLQFRGKVSEKFERALKKLDTPCKVIFTLRKLKTVMPSLKAPVDKSLRSKVVYQISCPCCAACYVGQTSRHLLYRIKEHQRQSSPVGAHFRLCNVVVTMDDVKIIASTCKTIGHLMTLEAILIDKIKPLLNTKDEYRSRALVIKF